MDELRSAVAEPLRQVIEGADIPSPESLLKNLTAESAAVQLPDSPYSILTNLAHADFWQQLWLDRLNGKRAKSFLADWQTPPKEDWFNLCERFQFGLSEAILIASSDPFEHQMKSDRVAIKTLLQIAIHDSYHLGQINLLKRQLRLSKKKAPA